MSNQRLHTDLLAAVNRASSRRNFLKGVAATGAAVTGLGLLNSSAHAQTAGPIIEGVFSPDDPITIFSVAATAERLAVTFYTNGIMNASALGLSGANLDAIIAAAIEEQIHELFFEANGGVPLASTFSFPSGASTFTSLATFIATQQMLEGAFDSAFIAAVQEFAELGRPDLARIACQIAMIESEHRALGRYIGGLDPADNWAFAPQLVPSVGAAPGVLAGAGFLSPTTGNSYSYSQIDFTASPYAAVFGNVQFQAPFTAGPSGTPTATQFAPNPNASGLITPVPMPSPTPGR